MLRCALFSLVLCSIAHATPPQPAEPAEPAEPAQPVTGVVVDADATADPAGAAPQDTASESDTRPAADDDRAGTATVADAPPTTIVAPANADQREAVVVDATATVVEPVLEAAPEAPAPPVAPAALPAGLTFSGIPAVTFDADKGLGFGLVAAAYLNDGITAPYRTAITLQLYLTTKLVQDHNIVVDSLRVFDLPLRLNARIGYLSSLSQNYCGVGGSVTCDKAVAAAQASANGLVDDKDNDDDAYDQFTRRYYQRRFMDPYGLLNLRYALVERRPNQPTRVEITGGYRAFAFIPGNVFADDDGDGQPDLTPYAGSLYAKDHPDGEGGLSSVVNLGIMIDSRDNEPAPTQGWWLEGSVRATTPGVSTWTFAGFNVTVRGYTTLPIALPNGGNLGKRLVLANRFTVDGLVGDVPIQEMARLGGSFDAYTFGGSDVGRGIRVQRYLGKARVINMTELRYRFAEIAAFEQAFAFTAVGFVDAAIVGDELVAPTDLGVVGSGGGALRVAWNENFIVRLDVGVSPAEQFAPQVYITINQPF